MSPEGFIYVIHINTYIRLYGILLILLSYILIFIYVYVLLHNSNVGNMSYKKTLKIYELLEDKEGIANSYNNIGANYNYQGQYLNALEFYHKALKIQTRIGDKVGMNGTSIVARSRKISIGSGTQIAPNVTILDLGAAFQSLATNNSVADPFTGMTWAERVAETVHLDGDKIVHIRIEVKVDASTSTDSSRVVQWFEEELGSEDDSRKMRSELSGIAKIYVTGDLVSLQNVLDGLNSSQLSSTAISFAVSFIVLLLLTRRMVTAMVVLTPVVFF